MVPGARSWNEDQPPRFTHHNPKVTKTIPDTLTRSRPDDASNLTSRAKEEEILPLQHQLERKSSGPSSYTGDRRNLKGSEKLLLGAFNRIECELSDTDPTNLSCDQKYLLDICTAISSSVVSSDLAKRQPGMLNLALWLTTANQILKLYISTSDPSNKSSIFVAFILSFYAPSCFRIKLHYIKDDARHLWHFISSSRYLPKKYRDINEPVISRNAYFAVPENMLLAMLTDERCHIRTLAAR
ncbi:hypothetical protein AVEN_206273-1 [Araneus ventricosus]|uniref:Uncharacterized protein n=1 Tax=Araneus ventricosus TaxID=182803 RepID=A0A4Y2PVP8_ARAVE|nr:hypothetical protein AVEN_206273-1 [Araneus ventricosus]